MSGKLLDAAEFIQIPAVKTDLLSFLILSSIAEPSEDVRALSLGRVMFILQRSFFLIKIH